MSRRHHYYRPLRALVLTTLILFLSACMTSESGKSDQVDHLDQLDHLDHVEGRELLLPELDPILLAGRRLRVVATTSIIGDIVAQVGGEAIDLTILMAAGQDPHSYQPAARDLTLVSEADVIFVNGWDLEEALITDLRNVAGDVPQVPVSAHIEPLPFDGEEEGDQDEDDDHEADHDHAVDPHTWFSINNVRQWVTNIQGTLSALDPANGDSYTANASRYLASLDELEAEVEAVIATIAPERRLLVTNHDSLAYFAHEYGFEVVGTVIPGASTLSEPSANRLAALVGIMADRNICTLFAETTTNDDLAGTIADELNTCDQVQVLTLYTGALGAPGSGADTYIDMLRTNVEIIGVGLR